MRAKFNQSLKVNDSPITLQLFVSMGNERQTLTDLEAFLKLVENHNKNGHRIGEIHIILSCYLQRYYYGEEKSEQLYESWMSENRAILDDSTTPLKIIRWKQILDNPEFKVCAKEVQYLYEFNEQYKTIVDGIARSHSNKAGLEAAVNYLLEESSVFLLIGSHIAYPSGSLNGAVEYTLKNFNKIYHYHGYMFIPESVLKSEKQDYPKQKKDSEEEKIFRTASRLNRLFIQNGITEDDRKIKYFEKLLLKDEGHSIFDISEKKSLQLKG